MATYVVNFVLSGEGRYSASAIGMIVVDSSVWIDFFIGRRTGKTDLLLGIIGHQEVIVGDLILAEVLQGFRTDVAYKKARELLLLFEFRAMVGENIAVKSAQNYRLLKSKGLSVRSTIDSLIATFCIEGGFYLLHSDRDYGHFEKHCGLKAI